ncbi:MAG TPA: hypothetical protein ENK50_12165, partial [Sedimenticola sp.]|nr:hypothetical protein [Sedimenticola sp.]
MIHLAKSLVVKLALLAVVLLAIVALTLSAGRLAAPLVADLRVEAEHWASGQLGQPVRIGAIALQWRGLEPELILHDVTLFSPGDEQPVLRFAEGRVSIKLLDSLTSGAIQSGSVTLVGIDILVKRKADGSLVVSGLEGLNRNPGDAGALFLVPQRVSIVDGDIFWQDLSIGADPIHFTHVDALLVNRGNRHRFN